MQHTETTELTQREGQGRIKFIENWAENQMIILDGLKKLLSVSGVMFIFFGLFKSKRVSYFFSKADTKKVYPLLQEIDKAYLAYLTGGVDIDGFKKIFWKKNKQFLWVFKSIDLKPMPILNCCVFLYNYLHNNIGEACDWYEDSKIHLVGILNLIYKDKKELLKIGEVMNFYLSLFTFGENYVMANIDLETKLKNKLKSKIQGSNITESDFWLLLKQAYYKFSPNHQVDYVVYLLSTGLSKNILSNEVKRVAQTLELCADIREKNDEGDEKELYYEPFEEENIAKLSVQTTPASKQELLYILNALEVIFLLFNKTEFIKDFYKIFIYLFSSKIPEKKFRKYFLLLLGKYISNKTILKSFNIYYETFLLSAIDLIKEIAYNNLSANDFLSYLEELSDISEKGKRDYSIEKIIDNVKNIKKITDCILQNTYHYFSEKNLSGEVVEQKMIELLPFIRLKNNTILLAKRFLFTHSNFYDLFSDSGCTEENFVELFKEFKENNISGIKNLLFDFRKFLISRDIFMSALGLSETIIKVYRKRISREIIDLKNEILKGGINYITQFTRGKVLLKEIEGFIGHRVYSTIESKRRKVSSQEVLLISALVYKEIYNMIINPQNITEVEIHYYTSGDILSSLRQSIKSAYEEVNNFVKNKRNINIENEHLLIYFIWLLFYNEKDIFLPFNRFEIILNQIKHNGNNVKNKENVLTKVSFFREIKDNVVHGDKISDKDTLTRVIAYVKSNLKRVRRIFSNYRINNEVINQIMNSTDKRALMYICAALYEEYKETLFKKSGIIKNIVLQYIFYISTDDLLTEGEAEKLFFLKKTNSQTVINTNHRIRLLSEEKDKLLEILRANPDATLKKVQAQFYQVTQKYISKVSIWKIRRKFCIPNQKKIKKKPLKK